jgi:hypothetical protein
MNEGDAKEPHYERVIKNFREYYNKVGWARTAEGRFTDTTLAISFTRLQDWHASKTLMMSKKNLTETGTYFLDAGCGAVPRDVYSKGYRHHVCFDFSIEGLTAARERLGGRGFFYRR